MTQTTASAIVKLRSLTAKFDAGVTATTPYYPRLCTVIPSTGYDEEYGMLGAVPQVREWIDDRQFRDSRAVNFSIVNKHWESSKAIKKTDIDDDRLGLYSPVLEEMGKRAARHPDKLLLSDLIANAETKPCLDGQYFFDTDHAWGDSGTQSNKLSATAVSAAAPTLDEFKALLNSAFNQLLGYKDDQGEFIHDDAVIGSGQGMELELVVPLAYREVANKAVTAGIFVNGGDTNVVLTNATVVASPHITGTLFDLYRTDVAFKPYIFQARAPLSRKMKGMDDMEFKDVKFMTEARYNLGYGAWWNAVRTKISNA